MARRARVVGKVSVPAFQRAFSLQDVVVVVAGEEKARREASFAFAFAFFAATLLRHR